MRVVTLDIDIGFSFCNQASCLQISLMVGLLVFYNQENGSGSCSRLQCVLKSSFVFCFFCFKNELKSVLLVVFPIKAQIFLLHWAITCLRTFLPNQFALWRKATKQKLILSKSIYVHPLYYHSQPTQMNQKQPMKALCASLRIIIHTTLWTLKGCKCCMWNGYHEWSPAQK